MTKPQVTTKVVLLSEIEQTWTALLAAINRLTEAQLTIPQDAQGWTAKDHLVHLAAWERSITSFLQGQPRHEGLGVAESMYLNGTFEDINEVIQQQHKNLPLADAITQLRDTHQQLLALLQPLTDDDLNQPYRHYLPDEPGRGDGSPAIDLIYGNTADHFADHLAWIETLVAKAA